MDCRSEKEEKSGVAEAAAGEKEEVGGRTAFGGKSAAAAVRGGDTGQDY